MGSFHCRWTVTLDVIGSCRPRVDVNTGVMDNGIGNVIGSIRVRRRSLSLDSQLVSTQFRCFDQPHQRIHWYLFTL